MINNRKKYIVLSPHPDDTCFSIGGTILKNRLEAKFINCDVFTEKKYNILNLPEDGINDIILKEETDAMRALGISNIMLGYMDVYLRKKCKLSEVFGKKFSRDHIRQESIYEQVKQSITKVINEVNPTGIFAPLGCGWHTDHLIVRIGVEEIIKTRQNLRLFLYEDMPYSANEGWLKEVLHDVEKKYHIKNYINQIDDVIESKNAIIHLYKTQVKERDIRMMNNYMSSIRKGFVCERIWEVQGERKYETWNS